MRGTPSRELHDGRTESSLAMLVSGSILKRLHCQYTITHHNHHAHNDHTMYHLCHIPLLLLSLHKPRQGPHLTLTAASGLGNQTNKDHTRVRIILVDQTLCLLSAGRQPLVSSDGAFSHKSIYLRPTNAQQFQRFTIQRHFPQSISPKHW